MAVTAVPDAEEQENEAEEAERGIGVESGAEPLGEGAEEETPEEEEPKPPRLLQEPLPGDWTEISGEFGGAAPETSEIRLLGGKMAIEGSYAKGTEIDLVVRVRVTGVLGQDVLDDWGKTTRTVRRHMARMISVRRLGK